MISITTTGRNGRGASRRVFVAALALLPLSGIAAPAAFAAALPQEPASPARAADEGILVQGVGEVTAKPDIARLTLGVETRSPEAAKAAEENARLTDTVLKAIRAAGVAEKDIQTSGYNLYRTEENAPLGGGGFGTAQADGQNPQNQPRRTVTYVANNSVRVTVRKVADAGKIIDAAVKAGANVAGGVQFDFADPKPLEDEALRLAVEDATRKAKVVGRAAGFSMLRLAAVAEAGADFPRPFYGGVALMAGRAADSAPPTSVEPGEQKITARVTARYLPTDQREGAGVIPVR